MSMPKWMIEELNLAPAAKKEQKPVVSPFAAAPAAEPKEDTPAAKPGVSVVVPTASAPKPTAAAAKQPFGRKPGRKPNK